MREGQAGPGAIKAPSFRLGLVHGIGAVAYGIKDSGLKFFLLLFYAQVVGLDSRLVSLAILIAILFDAISDPIVGYWSDNFRSRWGRRHPFMVFAALPLAISFYMLWVPPDLSDQALFWYLMVLAIIVRTFITFYETPSAALTAELSVDYDQRSSLLSFRQFFGWTGGNAIVVITFALIFPAFVTDNHTNGQFNRDAYAAYGLLAASTIFFAIMISSIGTAPEIKRLPQGGAARAHGLGKIFREIFSTLSSRSFFALFFGALLGFTATGLAGALNFYFSTYFWAFTTLQIGMLTLGIFVSAALGAYLAPLATRLWGKRKSAVRIGLVAFIAFPAPVFLRLIGVLPSNDDPFIFWFVLITNTLDVALIICFQILLQSMVADLVEQAELKTQKRSEGLFFASMTFVKKCGEGCGIIIAGFVIAYAGLMPGARQADVSPDTLWLLGAIYVPVVLVFWLSMIALISRYRIDRAVHNNHLEQLNMAPVAAPNRMN